MAAVVVEGTPIAVDHWQQTPGVRLYFLTHMHAGYNGCLGIFSSYISLNVSGGLSVGDAHIIGLDDSREETMTVTLLDANHCPGSVMFLFQGYFGNILCTGDFRYHVDMLKHSPIHSLTIDHVYLDNTYCNPAHVLPTQEEAQQTILDIILRHPDHHVVLGLDSLGKESLLVFLSTILQTMITVDSDRLARLSLLDLPPVFSTNPEDGFVRVVAKHAVNSSYLAECNHHTPTIGIVPTGYHPLWRADWTNNTDRTETGTTPFVVPYSLHSSYCELSAFLRCIHPGAVTPLRTDPHLSPSHWLPELVPTPKKRSLVIPPSVRHFMQQRGLSTWLNAQHLLSLIPSNGPFAVSNQSTRDKRQQLASPFPFTRYMQPKPLSYVDNVLKETTTVPDVASQSQSRSPESRCPQVQLLSTSQSSPTSASSIVTAVQTSQDQPTPPVENQPQEDVDKDEIDDESLCDELRFDNNVAKMRAHKPFADQVGVCPETSYTLYLPSSIEAPMLDTYINNCSPTNKNSNNNTKVNVDPRLSPNKCNGVANLTPVMSMTEPVISIKADPITVPRIPTPKAPATRQVPAFIQPRSPADAVATNHARQPVLPATLTTEQQIIGTNAIPAHALTQPPAIPLFDPLTMGGKPCPAKELDVMQSPHHPLTDSVECSLCHPKDTIKENCSIPASSTINNIPSPKTKKSTPMESQLHCNSNHQPQSLKSHQVNILKSRVNQAINSQKIRHKKEVMTCSSASQEQSLLSKEESQGEKRKENRMNVYGEDFTLLKHMLKLHKRICPN